MDETGVDFAMDVHGDEAIPANFLAGFEGIPSLHRRAARAVRPLRRRRSRALPDFQTEQGYEIPAPGQANMSMSTTQLAERFGAVSMTLEMPFKDNFDLPDDVYGWSPRALAAPRLRVPRRAPRDPSRAQAARRRGKRRAVRPPDADPRPAPPRPVAVEPRKSLHRLVGRRPDRPGVDEAKRRARCSPPRASTSTAASPASRPARSGRSHLALDAMGRLWLPGEKDWRLNERHYGGLTGLNKAETVGKHRRRAGQDLAPLLRHPAARRWQPGSPYRPHRRPPLRRDRDSAHARA